MPWGLDAPGHSDSSWMGTSPRARSTETGSPGRLGRPLPVHEGEGLSREPPAGGPVSSPVSPCSPGHLPHTTLPMRRCPNLPQGECA